tara:strand:+ start:64 stop:357 length:294 start_codon:yes stop_codon:yes gene_type:complete
MIQGFFYDPNHGGCLRQIVKQKNGDYHIIGAYGNDEAETGSIWTGIMKKTNKKNTFIVDFSGKKHVKHGPYKTIWFSKERKLKWEDNNEWKQMYHWY